MMRRSPPRRRTPLQARRAVEQDWRAMSYKQRRAFLLELWGKVVVARDQSCQCGSAPCRGRGPLVGHHMLRKGSHQGVMFNLENGIALRKGCHFTVHHAVTDYRGWHVERVGAERIERLETIDMIWRATNGKHDLAAVKLWLEQAARRYGVAA